MKTPPTEERQDIVLRLLRQRDEEGMRLLFKHYSGALMTIIASVIPQKEIAEEVLHDVLIKVWTSRSLILRSYKLLGKSRLPPAVPKCPRYDPPTT